jgi:hypothetical protein
MNLLIKSLKLFLIILAFLLIQCKEKKQEEKVVSDKIIPGGMKYILPSPSHLFAALERGKKIDWHELVDVNNETKYTSDVQTALNLGARSADGLVAVYAKNFKAAKQLWLVIDHLAKKINIDKALSKTKKKIQIALQAKDIVKLKKHFDESQSVAEKHLHDKKNDDIAVLISVGGWLEGMYLTTKGLKKKYDADAAELLRQSGLVEAYINRFNKMSNFITKNIVMQDIIKQMPKIKKLTYAKPGKSIKKKNVLELFKIAEKLKKTIESLEINEK